jgi:hypothetical protein
MSDENKGQQAAFVQSLRDLAEKQAATNPVLSDLRTLNQRLAAEARKRLAEEKLVYPFGGFVDKAGAVSVLDAHDADESLAFEKTMAALRTLARQGKIRAASVCIIVERPFSPGETPIQFLQFHSEHRTGLALLTGVPADEKVLMQGVPGVNGPAVAVYKKKLQPVIFAV